MPNKEAITKYIAAKLAIDTGHHVEASADLSNLLENTRNVHRKNREACEAFGVADSYNATLASLAQPGPIADIIADLLKLKD